ncbi:TetR/AcrR family transcriptional regulator [Agrobacterium pusense]|uniref:TetR/AcrR family transcriptional regulator n=1 Tax=Agrobacterium pusense TaxID=648995 RepID=UPI003D0A880F
MRETNSWSFSLREVARRAGVSHNAPYRHFADKAELLAAIGTAGYDALRGGLDRAAKSDADAVKALRAFIRSFISFALDDPSRHRLMVGNDLQDMDGSIAPELKAAADGARQVLKDLLLRGGANGQFAITINDPDDVSAAVVTIWALLHGYTLLELDRLRHLETLIDVDDLTGRVADRIIFGLIAPSAS